MDRLLEGVEWSDFQKSERRGNLAMISNTRVQTLSPAIQIAAKRIPHLDVARGLALMGMVVFHFARDLEIFGIARPGFTLSGAWMVFARLVAGSFFFISGVSFFLSHHEGVRWRAFTRRFLTISGAAALVSLATYVAMPDSYIYFGILHSLALASLVGLFLVRQPVVVMIAVALVALVLPEITRSTVFDAPWLVWVGLSTHVPRTLDYLPLLPWIAPFALGLAVGRLGEANRLWSILRERLWQPMGPVEGLAWIGRHSLAFYLLHQPILLALVWAGASLLT